MGLKIRTIIHAGIVFIVFFIFFVSGVNAQKKRWPIEVNGSYYGIGKPQIFTYGYQAEAITSIKEQKHMRKTRRRARPAEIHFVFEPFNASQLVVTETYNPGAISKVVIGCQPDKRLVKKTIWTGEPKPGEKKYNVRNFHFEYSKNITDVWMTIEYDIDEELNQFGGVCLVNSNINYTPELYLPRNEIFTKELRKITDNYSDTITPKGLILSADGHSLYFSHEEDGGEKIYKAELDSAKNISKVELSDFNLPDRISKTCGLVGVNQDNNVAYVSNMLLNKFQFYETYLGKSLFGKPKWKYKKKKIKNYKNGGVYIDYVMSYDGTIMILGYKERGRHGILYNENLYVSFKDKKGNWSDFMDMGSDINSLGSESPCFLASDNKTLYFFSDGRIGYGEGDIYVSKRLDESWTSWSEPYNLGPNINTEGNENSFTIDPASKKVYFIRWDGEESSNIYALDIVDDKRKNELSENGEMIAGNDSKKNENLKREEENEKLEDDVLPTPVTVVTGKTLNKKTGEPVQADIIYSDIFTGDVIGMALSNAETGEYTIILQNGMFFSIEARSDGFISENQSFNTSDIFDHENITVDLKLSPIEKNQTIQLNNIFFNSNEAVLLPESFLELNKLIDLMEKKSKMKIEIGGHTDDVGTDSYNLKLSKERADAVSSFLNENGIKSDRIISVGYGESRPLVLNDCEENRAVNRRVEFTILEIE